MKTVAIDFDGVLHRYSRGWRDGEIYDPPMAGAGAALRVLAQTYRLVVFTVRDDLDAVRAWLMKHGLSDFIEEVTNAKPIAVLYIDDRAYRFCGSWPEELAGVLRLLDA